jgi:hypothetical protein
MSSITPPRLFKQIPVNLRRFPVAVAVAVAAALGRDLGGFAPPSRDTARAPA